MSISTEPSVKKTPSTRAQALKVQRRFVPKGVDPYEQVKWVRRSSRIVGQKGEVIFDRQDVEAPEGWSQLATDIAVSKYFRRSGVPGEGSETSIRQLVYRVAHTIRQSGEEQGGYFASTEDAAAFEDELTHILLNQIGAFNSPVWFNCGLYHVYGIEGTGGHFALDQKTGKIVETSNSFRNPQCSACFIQNVEDDLMSIFDLVKKEAKLFKFGSGTGSNFSKIRGADEKLSGGGTSSGLMSFLKVLDQGAGATKSGGTTRRAAKMVCLDIDHPEIVDFVTWKMEEEKKVKALVDAGYSSDFNGEAYQTVSGQNSNNSVRISDEYMKALEAGGEWSTTQRTDGEVYKTYKAQELWDLIAESAWACADPGVQFDSTIQTWHTCPNTDRIRASNPCSEYMFLDDSACNLASVNLIKFLKEDGQLDLEAYRHACRILYIAQEILVDFSSYPTKEIAQNSHDYRPLGLGYANLGSFLMTRGLAYDSEEGRAWAGLLTAIMHGQACLTSTELAGAKGAFKGYAHNSTPMLKVMRRHRDSLKQLKKNLLPENLLAESRQIWDAVLEKGEKLGFRNAQSTVLAPTGTIGLLMDCDTTGIEPDFALVKFKKLAGGGYFKIVNQSVPRALQVMGYSQQQISEIVKYALGTMTLSGNTPISASGLLEKGFNEEDLKKVEAQLSSVMDLEQAFGAWVLGEETLKRLGVKEGDSVLEALGYTPAEIKASTLEICGRMGLEGAPYLKPEHLPVFDCANKCGTEGTRFLAPRSHILMMAAAQPFLSGAISKTVNMPQESTVQDIKDIYYEAWQLGLKAVAIYRDGSKMSQPLSSKADEKAQKAQGEYTQEDLEAAISEAVALAPARRRKLPLKRTGVTIEAEVGGHKIYIRTGEYEDGRLGEVFLDMHKEGATLRSLLNCFAISVSMGLQYGVPLEEYIKKFTFTRFEPKGMTNHPNIRTATSLIDFIFRVLGMEYLGQTDFVHVAPDPKSLVVEQRAASEDLSEPAKAGFFPEQLDLKLEKSAVGPSAPAAAETAGSQVGSMDQHLSGMMGDAPMCSDCGHVTVRNGSCYKCLNCGASEGCS